MDERSQFDPIELSQASTELLLDDSPDEEFQMLSGFIPIVIDADDEDSESESLLLHEYEAIEINISLEEKRRYAYKVLSTFYVMAFCIFVYTLVHTSAIIFIHFSGK